MPPPPRQRAPHLQPVQNHQRHPQAPTSNPSSAASSNNPYQTFLSQQSASRATSTGTSPLHEQPPIQQYSLPQSHYSIELPISPVEGPRSNRFPARGAASRQEAEARQQQEYRLLNEDGDSVIDFYGQNTTDERTGGFGGGLSSANPSPIDYSHGHQGNHNLLWLHHQQRLQQQVVAAQQREADRHLASPRLHEFVLQKPQEQSRALSSLPSSQTPTPPSSTAYTARSSTRRETFPHELERELSLLSVGDRGTGSPRAQGFGFNSEVVERVIEQPYYPPIPKLTSSPTSLSFSSSTIASKIHPHAPNPATSPPSLPPPTPSTPQSLLHDPPAPLPQVQTYRSYQEPPFSSSQVEEEAEEQTESSTESEASSASEEEDEAEEMSTSSTPASWISSFCSLQGHEYFAEVSEEFIEDDFNLTGLSSLVPLYKESLEMILDVEPDDEEEDELSDEEVDEDDSQQGVHPHRRRRERSATDMETLESQAELLYGLIHQRFITSRQGMQIMHEKYQNNHFGYCPRVFCNSARVLPCGYSDTPGVETVKLYCPSCMDMYVPPNSRFQNVDGAFFGTTFPTLFFLTFPEIEVGTMPIPPSISGSSGSGPPGGYKPSPSQLKKQKQEQAEQRVINGVLESNLAPGLGRGKMYEMKIYGFRVSERAKSGPRMKWLRSKPDDLSALDEMNKAHGNGVEAGEDVEAREREGTVVPRQSAERQLVERKPVRRSARRRQ